MVEMKSMRDTFGEVLVELGKCNDKLVVLSGDLEDSTRTILFKKNFPDRFFNLGIAEQDIVGTAVGFSKEGFIPVVSSFVSFLTNRAYDQIRVSVCYNNSNVKLVGTHAGLTVGPDGATAQALEDISIMRVLPGMKVVCPADAIETGKVIRSIMDIDGPVYVRLSRAPSPVITVDSDPFVFGKANLIKPGKDVTIIACGIMVAESIFASELLKQMGIDAAVINLHTIKPIDKQTILDSVLLTGAVVTAEEHQKFGGMGSAVCEVLAESFPVPVEMVAVQDTFGESGTPEELLQKYNLKAVDVVNAIKKVIDRK